MIPCNNACGVIFFSQIDVGIIQRQVNVGFFVLIVFILAIQIHTDINAVATGGQVGILDCQVNICTLAHLDDGFIFFGICICGHFSRGVSRGAGIHIHAVNHDFHIVAFGTIGLGRLLDILHNGDGVCGLRRGTVLCVVGRRICGLCGIIRRCGFLCAIVGVFGVISGWRDFSRWCVAVLDVDHTLIRFILIDVGAGAVLTLITVRTIAILILVNSYTAITQIIRHRRSAGANRAHCNRSSQRHCCQLEFLVCHFSSAPFQFMLT